LWIVTVLIRRNLAGNTFSNRNGTDTEQVQECEQTGNGTGKEQVQNIYRMDTEWKWNGYGTVTNHKNGKKALSRMQTIGERVLQNTC